MKIDRSFVCVLNHLFIVDTNTITNSSATSIKSLTNEFIDNSATEIDCEMNQIT